MYWSIHQGKDWVDKVSKLFIVWPFHYRPEPMINKLYTWEHVILYPWLKCPLWKRFWVSFTSCFLSLFTFCCFSLSLSLCCWAFTSLYFGGKSFLTTFNISVGFDGRKCRGSGTGFSWEFWVNFAWSLPYSLASLDESCLFWQSLTDLCTS